MAATENLMHDEIIGKAHFTTPEDRKGSSHNLRKAELLKIKEELQANEIAYAHFLEFCAKYRAYFENNGPEEPISFKSFQADLSGKCNA